MASQEKREFDKYLKFLTSKVREGIDTVSREVYRLLCYMLVSVKLQNGPS